MKVRVFFLLGDQGGETAVFLDTDTLPEAERLGCEQSLQRLATLQSRKTRRTRGFRISSTHGLVLTIDTQEAELPVLLSQVARAAMRTCLVTTKDGEVLSPRQAAVARWYSNTFGRLGWGFVDPHLSSAGARGLVS